MHGSALSDAIPSIRSPRRLERNRDFSLIFLPYILCYSVMVKKQIKNGTIHRYLRVLGVGLDILKTRIDQDCHGHYPLSGEMAEWSKALVLGTSLNRRGFKSHSRQRFGK